MRIARVEITRFRGFQSFVFIPREHVVVVGEPRAGRSDLIAALRRVLEPRSVISRPSEWDVFRPLPESPSPDGDENQSSSSKPLTSVEISLLALSDETEQVVQDQRQGGSTALARGDADRVGVAQRGVDLGAVEEQVHPLVLRGCHLVGGDRDRARAGRDVFDAGIDDAAHGLGDGLDGPSVAHRLGPGPRVSR